MSAIRCTAKSQAGALLTDLYQLTMLQGYFDQGMDEVAVFEFFVRKLPRWRNFLMAAGLEQALEYLEDLRFTRDELDWLLSRRGFRRSFVGYLKRPRHEAKTPWHTFENTEPIEYTHEEMAVRPTEEAVRWIDLPLSMRCTKRRLSS